MEVRKIFANVAVKIVHVQNVFKNIKQNVYVYNGIFHPGGAPLTKKILGKSGNSILHMIWKEVNKKKAMDYLSDIQWMSYILLTRHGFTFSLSDCALTNREEIDKYLFEIKAATLKISKGDRNDKEKEGLINLKVNELLGGVGSLAEKYAAGGIKNNILMMKNSFAKGTIENFSQIVCFLGQQALQGARIPKTLNNE